MIERYGFDERAALAMRSACGMDDDATFVDRARETEFWGLYDPEPVGAVLIEMDGGRASLHVGCLSNGRAGRAIRRIVNAALVSHGRLYAAIRISSISAQRLAVGLGFEPLVARGIHVVYGRSA